MSLWVEMLSGITIELKTSVKRRLAKSAAYSIMQLNTKNSFCCFLDEIFLWLSRDRPDDMVGCGCRMTFESVMELWNFPRAGFHDLIVCCGFTRWTESVLLKKYSRRRSHYDFASQASLENIGFLARR